MKNFQPSANGLIWTNSAKSPYQNRSSKSERGLSLLELVVVLAIGAMIVLALTQVLLMGVRSLAVQESSVHAIDTESFALQSMAANIRLAGFGMGDDVLAVKPASILLDLAQLSWQSVADDASVAMYLSDSSAKTSYANTTDGASDQLTIIYRAPQTMWDCEGKLALGARRVRLASGEMADVAGQVVIERYFVEQAPSLSAQNATQNAQDSARTLNLRCDSARFVPERIERDGVRDVERSSSYLNAIIDAQAKTKQANRIYGLGVESEIVASGVEGFWVELGVQLADGVRFVSADEYRALAGGYWAQARQADGAQNAAGDFSDDFSDDLNDNSPPPIVSVRLALISRAPLSLPSGQQAQTVFEVFGKRKTIADDAPNHKRTLHQTHITLRNALAD
ncbi:hypothetical protein B0181_08945 [Moraxella caviae]|uniref:Tfp pilus assembly protein PilW n=1 Tax=Moraxella caviae TaxID=34060 RepID=A0A1S9ZX93_9GAMM|nr:prepilin-type N-terminal cleavage/methylation domain-containing protein [Moraxella caviae]OOR88070.1 hypothetical protein B0181_08945 [Moraxella caviae]STZ09990.1 Tfp pilus assembly protein PilW [Moraxella caviae]VEW12959.1 Tfp pilus assembly protein PilW [Moraxella caviae]